jgi:hypothetical protein
MNYANEPSTDLQESGEDVSAKTRQELIRRYSMIVYDYLAIMSSSDTLKIMESAKYTVQLGLNAITHIYKIAFCMTKNVATSADHCQKGIYCFIEYIEQTYKLGYINGHGGGGQGGAPQFDLMDAIMFIYDKTISELRNENSDNLDERNGSSAFTNILSVSQSHQAHGADFLKCKSALEHFGQIMSTLLWFSHPTMSLTDQMEIVDSHLMDFLGHSLNNGRSSDKTLGLGRSLDKDLFLFVETVQETVDGMEKKEYMEFLVALKKQIIKQEKKQIDTMSVLPACLYLKTLSGMTMKEIMEQEKWKRGADDLAKLVFHLSG